MRVLNRAVVLAALAPAAAVGQVNAPAQITGTRLDIVALGEVKRIPDIAIITAGVVTNGVDARTALSQNSARMTQVLTALKRSGVADRDVATSQISLQPQYRYGENQPPVVTGYQASNSVTIRFRDVAKSGSILDTLVAQGANQVNGPSLTIDKPESALDEARAEAVRTARARAELYARATGLSVKRIVSVSESQDYGQRPPMAVMANAQMRGSDAKTEIVPGEQSVGVTLSVTFELD